MFELNAKLVRDEIYRRGLSIRQFAAMAGISEVTARRIIRDGAKASIKIVGTLSKIFNVDGDNFILKAEKKG